MKGPKKEDSEKVKCEKNRRNVSKKIKANCEVKVICYDYLAARTNEL